MNKKIVLLIVWAAFFIGQTISPAFAENAEETITVQVDGMFCPFCTYGVEKKLKALKGVKKVIVHLRRGKAEIRVKPGMTVSDKMINQAVEDAGFTPGPIERIGAGGGG